MPSQPLSHHPTQEPTGLIADVQRFSLHDGPGIRTTVFLKGCSLRCFWCHNPETIHARPEIQIHPERCIGCEACIAVCEHDARALVDGMLHYDRARCKVCGACVAACFAEATVMIGDRVTVAELMAQIQADRTFYETSGGGLTLSGGEPLLQPAFSKAVLARCHAAGIHTAIETAGHIAWDAFADVLPHVDLVMMDLKQIDSDRHRQATGVPNERILANARRLAAVNVPIVFRVPVVPGVNDREADIRAIANFVRELVNVRAGLGPEVAPITLELLAFHRLAADKYQSLGVDYRASQLEPPSAEQMARLVGVAQACDLMVRGPASG